MASVTVIVWEITDDYDSPHNTNGFADGNFIHCILDDVALTLSVQIRSSSEIGGGTLIASPSDGPQLFFVDGGSATNNFPGTPTPQPFWSRCSGTTLQKISPNNIFPYASIGSTPNASQCQITPVCDLTISDVYSVTPATGPSNADGAVTISATSSNGTIRYSLTEGFDYPTGQLSTTFNNLVPGDYTIYAKDPIGCTDEINISIPVTTSYGVHHRFEYDTKDPEQQTTRIDIEERGYSGDVTEHECLGDIPYIWSCEPNQSNDPYATQFYGEVTINLLTRTNFEWSELFTDDQTKYKVKFYRFESSQWVLKYVGFIVPSTYSEPYLNPPFNTEITVSDGIRALENEDFVDDDGNHLRQRLPLITIIALILRKTRLNLSIRCAVDILEQAMNATDDDDVLAQAYIDARIFYSDKDEPDNCSEVLDKILLSLGACIKSALGYYWIIRREKSTGSIAYRQFDSNGDFEESGTFESEVEIRTPSNLSAGDVKWRDAAQELHMQKSYGKFSVIHDLMPDNNLIDSGSFELQYITETGGQLGFVDWNVLVAQAGLRYGFEAVKNGDSRGAFYFDFQNANVDQDDNILYSKTIRVKSSVFDFSFQYYVEPEFNNFPFVRIAYQIKASPVGGGTSLYLDPFGRWDGGGTEHINDIYATSYNSWQKFERRIPAFTSVDPDGYDIEIKFYSHNHYGADVTDDDFGTLKAIPTTGQYTIGKRIYYDDDDAGVLRAYTLKQSFETESTPDRVRPDDYSSPSNQKVWFLDDTLDLGAGQSFVRKVLFDNVVFTQLVLILQPTTYYSDAPNPVTYELITNKFNKFEKTVEVVVGDAPTDEGALDASIPNPEVYRSWLSLSDGTPTENWNRRGVTETRALLDILLADYANQMNVPSRMLTGTLMGSTFLSPVHCLVDADNDDRVYNIIDYEMDDRNNACRVTLVEVVGAAPAGTTPPELAGFTTGFSLGFNA